MNLEEFEKQFESYCQLWYDKKDLDYLNLEAGKLADVAHNVRIIAYRTDLGNKVIFSLVKQNRIHILNLKEYFKDQSEKLDKLLRLAEIVKSQRANIKALLQGQEALKEEISQLRRDYLARRPLSKRDVKELVLQISEQPKFIEKHTEALTKELTRKVAKVEELIHQFKEASLG